VAELLADDGHLAVFFLGLFHQIADVDKKLAVEMGAAGAVEPEKIVSRSSRRLRGRARRNVLHGNVVDRNRDLVLLAPVLGEFVEPSVVFRNEMGPLHDGQRFVLGERLRYERRGEHRRGTGRRKSEARLLEETASRDRRKSVGTHRGVLLCFDSSWKRRVQMKDEPLVLNCFY